MKIIVYLFIGVLMGGAGMSEQLSFLSNEELKKCVNKKGYVVPESSYNHL